MRTVTFCILCCFTSAAFAGVWKDDLPVEQPSRYQQVTNFLLQRALDGVSFIVADASLQVVNSTIEQLGNTSPGALLGQYTPGILKKLVQIIGTSLVVSHTFESTRKTLSAMVSSSLPVKQYSFGVSRIDKLAEEQQNQHSPLLVHAGFFVNGPIVRTCRFFVPLTTQSMTRSFLPIALALRLALPVRNTLVTTVNDYSRILYNKLFIPVSIDFSSAEKTATTLILRAFRTIMVGDVQAGIVGQIARAADQFIAQPLDALITPHVQDEVLCAGINCAECLLEIAAQVPSEHESLCGEWKKKGHMSREEFEAAACSEHYKDHLCASHAISYLIGVLKTRCAAEKITLSNEDILQVKSFFKDSAQLLGELTVAERTELVQMVFQKIHESFTYADILMAFGRVRSAHNKVLIEREFTGLFEQLPSSILTLIISLNDVQIRKMCQKLTAIIGAISVAQVQDVISQDCVNLA